MLPTDWSDEKKSLEMQVPDWLVTLLYRCLEKKPEDRFRNGVELHHFLSHHRIYTPEVAGIVKKEDNKWQSVIAEKNYELQDLKAIIARQDKELQMVRQKKAVAETPVYNGRKTVSKSAFNALLLLLFLMGGLAVYGLFFNKSVVGSANTADQDLITGDTSMLKGEQSTVVVSENQSAAKKPTKEARKRQIRDSVAAARSTASTAPEENNAPANNQDAESSEETAKPSNNTNNTAEEKKEESAAKKSDEESNSNNEGKGVRYKVRNKAYFHNEPDADTRRDAFIVHWNNAVLSPLAEKNGFVYIVFTNNLGQVSKGWISKADLVEAK
jgi:serine/threonine-protein kinase